MEVYLLNSIVTIFGLSIAVVFLCNRFRIPAIVGFIITGLLVGPHGLSLISAISEVEVLSEIGIILLLFTIGLEFSFRSLWNIKGPVLIGGSLQIFLTIFACAVTTIFFGLSISESILIGFLIALSSTAIVLKILQERGEVDTPHGRMTLGILVFQDIVAIPMMMALPFLAGVGISAGRESLMVILIWDLFIIVFLLISAKWLIPRLLFEIAKTRNRELFLLFIVAICIGVAWLTSLAGLSLALGALLAGLIISESEYSNQAIGNIIPFRDVFTSFFFVSIGMLFDVRFLTQHLWLVFGLVIAVLIGKAFIGALAPALLGYPIRTMLLVGIGLSQIGEFSFILSRSGIEFGILSSSSYQLFIAIALITMAITPFMISIGPRIVSIAGRMPLPERLRTGFIPGGEYRPPPLRDHLIIVGYGINGRNLARAARMGGIQYIILEMNPETVRTERLKGEPISYGDATNEEVLVHAGIQQARIIVVVINDPVSTRKITDISRKLNPGIYIIVRTRYIQEMKPLYELGADEVIPEEFETSVEIFIRVLRKYLVSQDAIEKLIADVRADNYQMLRSLPRTSASISDLTLNVPDIEVATFRVPADSPACGKSLAEINLRRKYGVTVVAIHRQETILSNPDGDTSFEPNDRVVVLGLPQKIAEVSILFRSSNE